MIELTGVSKRYGRKGLRPDALRDASLTVPAGGVWAVVGPNGAGKSTLLSLILGFIRPSEGGVTIDGDTPRGYLRDHGAGYLPERFSLPAAWRAGDALRMFARLDGAAHDEPAHMVELLTLESHVGKRVGELSRGTLQRLGIAQALLAGRDLVVLDEPTEGLDPLWRVRLRDIIADRRSDTRTILIASHDLGEIERIADRAVILDGGSVRDIIDVRSPGPPARYRLSLAAPFEGIAALFPDAERAGELEYLIRVVSSAELSQRLGALLESGALIRAVEPVRTPLEERVRDALDGEA
ncbi:MAG TPA: ABC transporter ATP-binding protein [Longimicrobiales bacterium]